MMEPPSPSMDAPTDDAAETTRGDIAGRNPPIDSRLKELRALAVDDAVAWSDASEAALRRFVTRHRVARPLVERLGNGNLRAVWRAGRERQIALQFLGGDSVRFVLVRRQPDADVMSRAAGRTGFDGALALIAAMGLGPLLTY